MLQTTVGDLFRKAVHHYRDRVAVKQGSRVITYAELGEQVNRLANALLGLGLGRGDRVALLMGNCPEYVVCDFAVATAGLVKVPLNHLLTRDDVAFRIQDAEAAAVICDGHFAPMVQKLTPACPSLRHRICVVEPGGRPPQGFVLFDRLLAQASAREPGVEVAHEDLIGIMYTGGTTGRSKGVMHTHRSVLAIAFSEIVEMDVGRGEILLQVAPLPHATQFMLLPGLVRGGTHVLMKKFDPDEVMQTIERERISWTFMVPTMIYVLLDHPALQKYDHTSLRTLIYGAAPMSPDKLERAMELMGPVFVQIYSQMEVANQTTALSKEDHVAALAQARERLSSCGRPIAMAQVRIVDPEDRDVPVGEPGEIITRGPHMMRGYWRREEETAKTMRGGWIHTGDVARADEDGYIYIVDRAKDMIISGGMNVYSVEVENVLMEHPAVREACVIGVPDDKWGEAVTALVVLREDARVAAEELIAFAGRKLAAYSRPKQVEFVPEIPKTPYGKIDKKAMRAQFWQGQGRQIH
ncbi:MAG: long-chain-fatty-acid--CoA ligase [Candidatus Rokuibacteriota bacterium]